MAFINMLEVVYPVGSVYISTAATGSGTNYLPYYYGVYIYKRTA